jgi:hypothetical protein
VIGYYDRDSTPITRLQWARDLENRSKVRVAETTLADGTWISTVWLGLDHQFDAGPPLIFETMVFPSPGELVDRECERYSTEAEALAGHDAMVRKWSATP